MTTIHKGYVQITKDGVNFGKWLVQTPEENQWGFSLHDDDQSWPGGFPFSEWRAVPEAKVPQNVKNSLGWLLD
jgi:hypothetical protein